MLSFLSARSAAARVALTLAPSASLAPRAAVAMLVLGKPRSGPPPATTARVEPWFGGTALGLRGEF